MEVSILFFSIRTQKEQANNKMRPKFSPSMLSPAAIIVSQNFVHACEQIACKQGYFEGQFVMLIWIQCERKED